MQLTLTSVESMQQIGERIGASLQGGECIQLVGDIGAGKTTLTKGIARGLGITETVQSPTFTINRVYDALNGLRLSHYDFYRLSEPGIMKDELAETLTDTSTVTVIEWGQSVADVLPEDNLEITIVSPSESVRQMTIEAKGKRSKEVETRIA